jgi:tRNA/rRNA methyltransferase
MGLRDQLTVVLHQIRSPDNLGAVARLMANFGFSRLVLSEPVTYAFTQAEKLAIRGERLLETMRVEKALDQALSDCVYACGTTSRRVEGRVALTPEQAASRLAEHAARGQVALVFGGEKRGLSDEELSRCQDLLVIPTQPDQPSMNLSQAASVLLFLCSRQDAAPARAQPEGEGARLGTVQALEKRMGEVLLRAGFLNPQAPEHVLGELVRGLLRSKPTQREVELWLTAFKQLQRSLALGKGPGTELGEGPGKTKGASGEDPPTPRGTDGEGEAG